MRDGPQLVELVALDGRPRIEGMEVSAPAFASVRANAAQGRPGPRTMWISSQKGGLQMLEEQKQIW